MKAPHAQLTGVQKAPRHEVAAADTMRVDRVDLATPLLLFSLNWLPASRLLLPRSRLERSDIGL